jgi:quercetin dioxygenase-like cupin family protein
MKTALLILLSSLGIAAQDRPPAAVNTVFPPGEYLESEHFTGPVWVERLLVAGEGQGAVPVGNVTFPPGSRSNWHHHPAGQSLLVLDGVGYYQQRGEPVRVLRRGQTVQCPPGVDHWHGAAHDRYFVQLALTVEHPDGRVLWGDPVTEEEYGEGITGRYRHLARVAALTTRGDLEGLSSALSAALAAGLTVEELRETLVHLYAYAGFPRSIQGLKILLSVAEGRELPADTEGGRRSAGATPTETKYEQGRQTLESLTGRPWTEPSDYGTFAPRIDTFLKEHLFADVFANPVLSYADREVITVATLIALGEGVEPMLDGHRGIARYQGVTDEQLQTIEGVVDATLD